MEAAKEFTTKLESKFLDKIEMKAIQPKIKAIHKGPIESVSVWKSKDKENDELVSEGFVLFRKVTPKDKLPGRKLIAVLKFKCRLSDIGEDATYFLNDTEIKEDEAKKYLEILD